MIFLYDLCLVILYLSLIAGLPTDRLAIWYISIIRPDQWRLRAQRLKPPKSGQIPPPNLIEHLQV